MLPFANVDRLTFAVERAYIQDAVIIRWVDGDTVDMMVDWGNRIHTAPERLRLYGIDTPERGQPGYREATVFNTLKAPVGALVRIQTFKDAADKYGRLLAVVYLDGQTVTLNDQLIEAGLAVPYFGGTKGVTP